MAESSNLVIVFGIYVMLILMILHTVFFKYEISSILDIENFKIPPLNKLTLLIKIFEQILQIIIEFSKHKFNKIKDKLSKYKFNLSGLILSFFDYVKDDVEENSKGGEGWYKFIQRNIVVTLMTLVIFMFSLYIIVNIISGVITGGIIVLLTNIPLIIGSLIGIAIIIILASILFLLFSDNTLDIIQCAEGLDASGELKDRDTMQDYEKLKMKLCKYWIDTSAPNLIFWPTLWGKINNIKVTQVIKDQTGKIIKIILPGNVIYSVNYVDSLPDEDSQEHKRFKASGDRIIYILTASADLLKKNVYIFKDLKKVIYLPKNIFKVFRKDYKDHIMKYYGYNNIYYMFLQPFVVMVILGIILSLRELFISPKSSQGNPSTEPSNGIIIFILKMIILYLPGNYILGMIGHLDLIKEDDVQPHMILLLFEIVVYLFFAGGTILKKGLIDNNTDIIKSFGISGIGGSIILIFIACIYKILLSDLIGCEIIGKSNCKATFYTLREQIKTCDEQDKRKDIFTNFSNKRNNNNNIGYARIKDQFTQSKMVYDCDKPPTSNKDFYEQSATKFSNSWNKIIIGRGKKEDYLYVNNVGFTILVTSILVGYLSKFTKPITISETTIFPSPIEIGKQLKPFSTWFNILYIIFFISSYSFLLEGTNKKLVPIILSSIPDMLVLISSIMMVFQN
tara:strand:+ start:1564 stop:3597 length:2034 start_codon:yes stop_codon:yes gene_type:complete